MIKISLSARSAAAASALKRASALGLCTAAAGLAALLAGSPARAESAASACSKFASTQGSDAASGSASEPYATLQKLVSSLQPGQTGCLQSGQVFDSSENVTLEEGEVNGQPGAPVTITSTEPSNPAIITHSLSLAKGADWITFTHLVFRWSMPKPWTCWNAAGNPTGFTCPLTNTQPEDPEDATQIAVNAHHDSFTYDDVSSEGTDICINSGSWNGSTSEYLLIEHDRIHDCGPAITGAKKVNEENGWHDHGVYDYGKFTLIKNNYIYDNSRNGILFYPTGEGGVAEHNIIDGNGNGITFGPNRNAVARYNIITNSSSVCGKRCFDTGISSNESGAGNEASHNCLDNNLSGEIVVANVALRENKLDTNPQYLDAANHEYALAANSPCLGYGPDTAQPGQSEPLLSGSLKPIRLGASSRSRLAARASRASRSSAHGQGASTGVQGRSRSHRAVLARRRHARSAARRHARRLHRRRKRVA